MRRQNFYGDDSIEAGISGFVNLAHSTCTYRREDFVRPELCTRIQQEIPRSARDFGSRLGRRQNTSTSYEPRRVPAASVISSFP